MENRVYIGTKLKRERLKKLMTQKQLSKAAGLSERSLILLEKDRTQPRPSTLVKLGKALDIDPASLIE